MVTGGSAGIRLATARLLHDAGATVALITREVARLEAAAGSVGSRAVPISCDVADTPFLPGPVDEVMVRCGSLDVLVNNAGVHHRGSMLHHPPDDLSEMLSANLTAPIVLARLVADVMGPGGRIVNVAGIAGKIPVPGSATYSGTKAGLRFWALAAAEDLAERGIGVATVNPGPVLSDFHRTQ